MFRKAYLLLLVLLSISLTGCFEILEEVNINTDGSGSVQYTLNLSRSKMKLHQIMKMDSINGYPVPNQWTITDSINSYYRLAQDVDGISNLKKKQDFENMIFSFSCDFASVDALNNLALVMNTGKPGKSIPGINEKHYAYDLENRVYYREGSYKIKREYEKLKAIDKAIFNAANYTSIVRSDRRVKSVENEEAIVSPSGKAVMLKFSIMDIIQQNKNITNKIYYEN